MKGLIKGFVSVIFLLVFEGSLFGQCHNTFNITATITPVTCAGGTTGRVQVTSVMNGTAPYTYSWISALGTPLGTAASVSNVRAGDYTITATDANGCQTNKTFTVPEALAAGPTTTDAPVCKGSTAILTASGAPVGGFYKWYTAAAGGIALPGENAGTFTTPEIKSTATWYVSSVTASACEGARAAVTAKMLNPLYPFVDLDSALIMNYKFDNNTVDATGKHSDATFNFPSANKFIRDRHGNNLGAAHVADLSGTGTGPFDYLDFGPSPDLQALTNRITISMWIFRTLATSTLAPMLNKWEGGNGFYMGTYLSNSSQPARKVLWKISGAEVVSAQDIPGAAWQHVVCLYTGTELQIYQDGVLTGSTPFTGNIPTTTVDLMFGRQADGATAAAQSARIDDLRIYNRALTAEEIKTLYNDESVAFDNAPVCAESTINLSTFAVPQAAFLWTGPGGFSSADRNPAILNAASTHAGNYALQVSKNGCTTPPQKASVTVNPLPATTISPSGATTMCEGSTVTLSAPTATSWLWSTGATTRQVTVTQQDTYSVQVTGANGCSDTSEPLAVTVIPVNDAPSFTKGTDVVAYEDMAQTIGSWATAISPGPAEATQTVSFQVSNDNNTLFTTQPSVSAAGNLSFTPAPDVSGVATVTISLKDDGGTNCGADQSPSQTFTITVNEVNDAPSFAIGTDVEILEGAGAQALPAWAAGITPGNNEAAQVVNFQAVADNSGIFSVQPAVSASGELTFTPSTNGYGVATVTVFLKDNGGTANGGVDQSASQIFTITVQEVNDAPSFVMGSDVLVAEDEAQHTINAWATGMSAGPLGEGTQTLNFIVTNNNNDLFTVQPSIDAAGNLSFTPAPDAWGSATVTVILHDDGGTANGGIDQTNGEIFTLTIRPVNDAPGFIKGNDVVVAEDAASQTIQGWATGIAAGAAEAAQTLNFIVSNNHPELFGAPPAVTSSGDLSFTVLPDVSGVATVTVTLHDDGGTTGGGVDRSATETFLIVVNAVNDAPLADAVDDITVPLNSDPVVVELTGIHAGVGEESQQISITASVDDSSIVTSVQITPLADGSVSLTLSPASDVSGTVIVTVVIKDDGGTALGGVDETTLSFTLTIEAGTPTLFLPNLFSPDANGMNDGFRVRAVGVGEIQFRVYTTEGQELFSTTDVTSATQTGWDGTYKGRLMPPGTYTWTLQGKYINGQPLTDGKNRFGQVILMR